MGASQNPCQVWQGHQSDRRGRQEEEEGQEEAGVLWFLHLQGAEASASRHGCVLQGHVHHELLCQRFVRAKLLERQASWLTTTRGLPSLLARSKLLSNCSCPASWPSTPCLKEPRLSPSTPAPSSY